VLLDVHTQKTCFVGAFKLKFYGKFNKRNKKYLAMPKTRNAESGKRKKVAEFRNKFFLSFREISD
jgi:hypothetical protein